MLESPEVDANIVRLFLKQQVFSSCVKTQIYFTPNPDEPESRWCLKIWF